MCLSAPASFIASGVLTLIGIGLVSRLKNKRLIPLGLIPLFFALQQAAEGVVWLYLPDETFAKNIYLFFALTFWPIWIPISLWIAETKRKEPLAFLSGMGLVLGAFLVITIPYMTAVPHGSSIQYLLELQDWQPFNNLTMIFYGAATVLPFFFSSIKKIWVLGMLAAIMGVVIQMVDAICFVSLWCFFSAITSMGLFYILRRDPFTTERHRATEK